MNFVAEKKACDAFSGELCQVREQAEWRVQERQRHMSATVVLNLLMLSDCHQRLTGKASSGEPEQKIMRTYLLFEHDIPHESKVLCPSL